MPVPFAALVPLALAPPGLVQLPEELPFGSLGRTLLEATADVQAAPQAGAEAGLLARLEPLHARIELGALELWLPRRVVTPAGELEDARPPREWKAIAAELLAVQRRWCDELGELEAADGLRLAAGLDLLEAWTRRAPAKAWPAMDAERTAAAGALRAALLGPDDARPLVLLLAPERAHFLGLIGVAGLVDPNHRTALWLPAARRSLQQPLSPSVLAVATSWGPAHPDDSPFLELQLDGSTLRQHVVHGASHLLANRLAPGAPAWFHEAVALLDAAVLTGADETMCSGYSGRPPTLFDGWRELPEAFLVFARIESSPYRSGGSADLFVDELRKARRREGFEVLDLDRGRVGLVTAGPFLARTARVPDEVRLGPHGLKEGFAELFRAYCGAFAAWLAAQDDDGTTLLDLTLRALRARAAAWEGGDNTPQLEQVLRELSGLALGDSLDPELDLEGRYQAWLQERR